MASVAPPLSASMTSMTSMTSMSTLSTMSSEWNISTMTGFTLPRQLSLVSKIENFDSSVAQFGVTISRMGNEKMKMKKENEKENENDNENEKGKEKASGKKKKEKREKRNKIGPCHFSDDGIVTEAGQYKAEIPENDQINGTIIVDIMKKYPIASIKIAEKGFYYNKNLGQLSRESKYSVLKKVSINNVIDMKDDLMNDERYRKSCGYPIYFVLKYSDLDGEMYEFLSENILCMVSKCGDKSDVMERRIRRKFGYEQKKEHFQGIEIHASTHTIWPFVNSNHNSNNNENVKIGIGFDDTFNEKKRCFDGGWIYQQVASLTNKACFDAVKKNKTRADRMTNIKRAKSRLLNTLTAHEKDVSSYINVLLLRFDDHFNQRLQKITIDILVKRNCNIDFGSIKLELFGNQEKKYSCNEDKKQ